MTEQVRAAAEASKRPIVRIGVIPWTTPVTQFPSGGFHLYDKDAPWAWPPTPPPTL